MIDLHRLQSLVKPISSDEIHQQDQHELSYYLQLPSQLYEDILIVRNEKELLQAASVLGVAVGHAMTLSITTELTSNGTESAWMSVEDEGLKWNSTNNAGLRVDRLPEDANISASNHCSDTHMYVDSKEDIKEGSSHMHLDETDIHDNQVNLRDHSRNKTRLVVGVDSEWRADFYKVPKSSGGTCVIQVWI